MKWRVAVAKDHSTRHTDYMTIEAATAEEAHAIALRKPNVRAVMWVAEPDPDRERS